MYSQKLINHMLYSVYVKSFRFFFNFLLVNTKQGSHKTVLPFLVKKSLEYFPAIMSLRGIIPNSSMIKAMWSAICMATNKGDCVHGWREGGNVGWLMGDKTKPHIDQTWLMVIYPLWEKGVAERKHAAEIWQHKDRSQQSDWLHYSISYLAQNPFKIRQKDNSEVQFLWWYLKRKPIQKKNSLAINDLVRFITSTVEWITCKHQKK